MRAALACLALVVPLALLGSCGGSRRAGDRPRPQPPPSQRAHLRAHVRPPRRPPQFVVVSFDGAGGAPLWEYWRSVAKRAHARFTFFVSGVYLLDWDHHDAYRPPRHTRGSSAIGFAPDAAWAAATLRQIVLGFREGDEIGTHYNGHFCSPDPAGVAAWTGADWTREIAQFRKLLFAHASLLPFGPSEVIGGRTPCLEGRPAVLYPVLARDGFRYDASQTALLGRWPRHEHGIWSFPLLEIPFVGHTFRVVSMDYNFYANQVEETPARIEQEAYRSIRNAFLAEYRGDRAPLSVGYHFETWEDGAYDRALTRFLLVACRLREVRCTTFRALAGWLDSLPYSVLHRYRSGRFPRFKRR